MIPESRIFEIPEKRNKILVVIKVHESIEAPHAIQNSTRVYIRTGSVSHPYELAEIDRIEYMLKRREKPAKRREELRQSARNRIKRFLNVLSSHKPYLYISVSPVFPYQPLISLDELYMFCNTIQFSSPAHYSVNDPGRITDGICKSSSDVDGFTYREINHYGLVFISETLDKTRHTLSHNQDERLFLRIPHFVLSIGMTLKLAEQFLNKCEYLGNLEVKVNVENIYAEYLLYNCRGGLTQIAEDKSIDNSTASSEIIAVEDIKFKFLDIVISLMQNILWVFAFPTENAKQIIQGILVSNKLITE